MTMLFLSKAMKSMTYVLLGIGGLILLYCMYLNPSAQMFAVLGFVCAALAIALKGSNELISICKNRRKGRDQHFLLTALPFVFATFMLWSCSVWLVWGAIQLSRRSN